MYVHNPEYQKFLPRAFSVITNVDTPFENAQRWMGKNTFHFLLLNDDNMIGEH